MKNQVFISYSHKNKVWLGRLQLHLTPWGKQIAPWSDDKIAASADWRQEIDSALDDSCAAILLVSPEFLASEFIADAELPRIFEAKQARGLKVFWIPISDCAYEQVEQIAGIQAASDPVKPLDLIQEPGKRHAALKRICEEIMQQLRSESTPPSPPAAAPVRPEGAHARKIVILYKRVDPDQQVMNVIQNALKLRGFEVYIDQNTNIGLVWANEIAQQLRNSDVVIPLVSRASIPSEMFSHELATAQDAARRQHGRPRILPVRIQYEGRLHDPLATILDPLQYFLWNSHDDDPCLVNMLTASLRSPDEVPIEVLPVPGGGLPPYSEFYASRKEDKEFNDAILRRDSIVFIKAPRQMGKTSLLARGLAIAKDLNAAIAMIDFQKLTEDRLTSLETFLLTLARSISRELKLDVAMESKSSASPTESFEDFLQAVLAKLPAEKSLVWAMDEVDTIFPCAFSTSFFGLLRAWHNERATKPEKNWNRLTVVLSCATEAGLLIKNLNQSPFNVGTRLTLKDFDQTNVEFLNKQYGQPLKADAALQSFRQLVGGHPYLVSRGLYQLRSSGQTVEEFLENATDEDGPYGDHLRHFMLLLAEQPELCAGLGKVLRREGPIDSVSFQQLRSGGLVSGENPQGATIRCNLYESYFSKHLSEAQTMKA